MECLNSLIDDRQFAECWWKSDLLTFETSIWMDFSLINHFKLFGLEKAFVHMVWPVANMCHLQAITPDDQFQFKEGFDEWNIEWLVIWRELVIYRLNFVAINRSNQNGLRVIRTHLEPVALVESSLWASVRTSWVKNKHIAFNISWQWFSEEFHWKLYDFLTRRLQCAIATSNESKLRTEQPRHLSHLRSTSFEECVQDVVHSRLSDPSLVEDVADDWWPWDDLEIVAPRFNTPKESTEHHPWPKLKRTIAFHPTESRWFDSKVRK